MDYLDLRFRFSKHQNEDQVKRLADLLSQFAREQGSSLGLGHVELRQYASMFKDYAQTCIKKRKFERRGSTTTICIKNGDDHETMVEAEVIQGDLPGEQKILFRPAVQQLVDQSQSLAGRLRLE
ncbi:hypothetical protein SLS58_009162 [Diplodia intermedia]|uniref:Uncharacterized protein n=1 Tax=Diplodia intermedia TaxID=856260 RepID=A0ABR3TDX8_9PEZI